ncbi:MAG: signal peptide protein [Chitinophagaceae bacterium]|jgi:hypothetical protein|nr:signal peptide protein [Chitinophagaceae bacterium]
MNKLYLLALVTVVSLSAGAQTAEDIINKYIIAAGGKEKLEGVTSLQLVQKVSLNTMLGAIDVPVNFIRVKDKLFRMSSTSELFGTGFSVVTDTSGWVMLPANAFSGEAKLQKMKEEERALLKPQMSAEGFFPELVNYIAKGYTAEYLGEGKGNGKASYKVKLKKDKDERTYFFDKKNGLVNSMMLKGAAVGAALGFDLSGMGGGRADKLEVTFNYSDYKEVSGISFPAKLTAELAMGTIETVISDIKVNETVDEKWYKAE